MRTLRAGDSGKDVTELQAKLKDEGYFPFSINSVYDERTVRAVSLFQENYFLPVTGSCGPETWSKIGVPMGGTLPPRDTLVIPMRPPSSGGASQGTPGRLPPSSGPEGGRISESDYEASAQQLNVDVAAIKAFAEVESSGRGFFTNGRPAILFERHWMFRRVRDKIGEQTAFAYMRQTPDIVNRNSGGYRGGIREYDRIERAARYDLDCSLESASWGLFQIMGFHWSRLGYSSISEMVEKMHQGENEHLKAVVGFIRTDNSLLNAIRNNNWREVARIYNGPNFAVNNYDVKLSQAYRRYLGG